MQQPYKIPLHHCQWCYKAAGRFIIDCLCIACESCFNKKKSWIDQNKKCLYCEKPTQRKFIDLKVNPQQGGIYFQNLNVSMKNVIKIQEFQSQVSRKYCRHLEKKIVKLQTVIKTFIKQFPQYQSCFENMMNQLQQRQNKNFRSKSVNQTDSLPSQQFSKIFFRNNTQKNFQKQNPQIRSNSKTAYFKPVNKMKKNLPSQKSSVNSHQLQNFDQERNNNIYPFFDTKQTESLYGDNMSKNSFKFGNHNKMKNPNNQQYNHIQSMKSFQSRNYMKVSKNQVPIQIYQVGGNNKFSDPTKKQVNLNNINMQTALRSIKSEDGRDCFLPFYQQIQMDGRHNNKKNQLSTDLNMQSPKFSRNQNVDSFVFHPKKGPK